MAAVTQRISSAPFSRAFFSNCHKYRYRLERFWEEHGEFVTYVMLNPSTADEVKNDPTVERCERRARAMGYKGFMVVNIFALKSTDPKALYAAEDPVGEDNNTYIKYACQSASKIICAWGTHGGYLNRGKAVYEMLTRTWPGRPIYCLGVTKHGHPKHPLYIGYDVKPMIYEGYP